MPQSWGEWSALAGIIALIGSGIGAVVLWIARQLYNDIGGRIDGCTSQLTETQKWQAYMEETHLPQTYARKDLIELQFREVRESNARVESAVREVKGDLKDSFHALRQTLLIVYKKDFERTNE